jgi:SAM-dependent methyltransferase
MTGKEISCQGKAGTIAQNNTEGHLMTETLVKDYYSSQVRAEWRRLIQDAYHRLEYETTLHFLEKYLPEKGLILDAGGGPGRYTIELAKRGYQVILLDFTPANLEFARRQIRRAKLQDRVEGVVEGSIVDLSQFTSNSFDAVVCLGGPLSHVLEEHKRDQAISELIRLARKDAPIFVSVMGRLSLLVIELVLFQPEIEMPHFKEIRDTGDYQGSRGFTACHFFLPEELRQAFENQGVTVLEMVGLEGIGSHHDRKVNQLAKNEQRWKIWLETHYQTCTHPSVVGISEHMLIVCRK